MKVVLYDGKDHYGAAREIKMEDGRLMLCERWHPGQKRRWEWIDRRMALRIMQWHPAGVKRQEFLEIAQDKNASYLEFSCLMDEVEAETRA